MFLKFFSVTDCYSVVPSTPTGIFQDRLLGGKLVTLRAMHISKWNRYCHTDFQSSDTMSTVPISVGERRGGFTEDGHVFIFWQDSEEWRGERWVLIRAAPSFRRLGRGVGNEQK